MQKEVQWGMVKNIQMIHVFFFVLFFSQLSDHRKGSVEFINASK